MSDFTRVTPGTPGTTFTVTPTAPGWEGAEPQRTVTPRARTYRHMDMAAVADMVLVTEHGQLYEDPIDYFLDAVPTVIITADPSTFLALLHAAFQDHPAWKYTLYKTYSDYGEGGVARVKLSTFGFRGDGFRKGRLHQCWDPRSVSPDVSARFLDGVTHRDLLAWGLDVRDWAQENSLELRNAYAGYGSQLLRDPRFYPEPRRRVPRATNEAVRQALPGNLITLQAPTRGETFTVTCVDQRSAHHRIVQELPLPSSNHLFARGYFNVYDTVDDYWCRPGDMLYEQIMSRHLGLIYAQVNTRVTLTAENGLRLPFQDYQGTKREFLWTNQLDFLSATGTQVEGIYAAWTSTSVDTGLSLYGRWAENQITHASATRKRWLKPLLHSTYGLLAARPRPLEVGHRAPWGGGMFLLGPREFPVKSVKLDTVSPAFVNVVQRGMIEAETQLRSVRMARMLTEAGCKVLHVHSDGLHVLGDLPLIPDTWSVSALTDVMYWDRVSWIANERTCLPGRDEHQRYEEQQHRVRLIAQSLAHQRSPRGVRGVIRSLARGRDV